MCLKTNKQTNNNTESISNFALTNDQGALNFLQDEASLVAELGALCSQHACQPVLSQHVVLHPQLKEISDDILHRLILFQATHVVKQNLENKGKNADASQGLEICG